MDVDKDGILDWLVYIVIFLGTSIFTLWNKALGRRMSEIEGDDNRIESKANANSTAIHGIQMGIHARFTEHEKEERARDEKHNADVAREFKELRSDVNTGHAAILKEVNAIARRIKNGNGKS